jgi:hypothetical protein
MNLSRIYQNRRPWAMVYNTTLYTLEVPEVEFVRDRFFASRKQALKWFKKNFRKKDFINPRPVRISGMEHLTICEL